MDGATIAAEGRLGRSSARRADLGLRAPLLVVALLVLLPACGLLGSVAWQSATTGRTRVIAVAEAMAQDIALAIEREATALQTMLAALATSPGLAAGGPEAFGRQAALLRLAEGVRVALRPSLPGPAPAEGAAQVSDLLDDPASGRPVIEITYRVPQSDPPLELVATAEAAGVWAAAVRRWPLAPGWTAVVLDRQGRLVAGSTSAEGASAWPGEILEGQAVPVAWRQPEGLPWVVLVAVPPPASWDGLASVAAPGVLTGAVLLAALSLLLIVWGRRCLPRLPVGAAAGSDAREPEGTEPAARRQPVLAATCAAPERQAAVALHDSELRFRTLAEAGPQIVWSNRADGRLDYLNPRFYEFTGLSPSLGPAELRPPIHPEDRAGTLDAWNRARAEGEPFEAEYRLRRADGVWRWFVARALPLRDADGRIRRWIGTSTDVTELVETREALQRQVAGEAAARQAAMQAARALAVSETRFRRFAEASPDGLWILDASADRLDFVSPAFERLWGEPADLQRGLGMLTARIIPEDRRLIEAAVPRLRAGEVQDLEFRIRRPDGGQRWVRLIGFPMGEMPSGGLRIGGFARDISCRKAAEAQQRLLIRELNHRVKNTLATVLSLAQQTARRRGRGEDGPLRHFLEDFQGRLLALARGHDLLTASTWRGAMLTDVAIAALSPWQAGERVGQITVTGSPIWLAPRQALALSLALHELATNAMRHGALAVSTGHVLLSWHQVEGAMLELGWQETDGPPVQAPPRRGFGSRLLEVGLPAELGEGATVALNYAAGGLKALVRFWPAQEGGEE